MADNIPTSGALESREETEKDKADFVERWMMELDLASAQEKSWREGAKKTIHRYRDENPSTAKPLERKGTAKFNILWSNTELLRPAMYSQSPRPDVRRRYRDKDPLGKQVAEVLERALSFAVDAYDFDYVMERAVLDYVLPGRAVTRVKYHPVFDKETQESEGEEFEPKIYESVDCHRVPWKRFRHGPGDDWTGVPWIAYEHLLTRDQIDKQFPGKEVELDVEVDSSGSKQSEKEETPDIFKRGRVWEIWDKEERRIIFLAPSYTQEVLKVEDDKLQLVGFFDCPRPMYSVESPDSLVPIDEYRLYRDQAEELDRITRRIQVIIQALRVRGIYDAALKEMATVMSGDDNDLIPSENVTHTAQTGGLEKHIWMMPIETAARVLVVLYEQRDQIKQTIYEIIGLSDILRGASDPNETLGAQQIKARSGSARLKRRIKEVARYARDLMRLKAEIISEHFSPATMAVMTGQEVTQEMVDLMRQDGRRGFTIDVETDSTIAVDEQTDQENVSRLITGIAQYVEAMALAVQTGSISSTAANAILMASVRRFKLGRDVETAIEESAEQEQGPDPQAQAQQQAEQQAQMQAEQQAQVEQAKVQEAGAKLKLEQQNQQIEAQFKQAEIGLKERDQGLKEAEFVHTQDMDGIQKRLDFAKLSDGVNARGESRDDAQMDKVIEGDMQEMEDDMREMAQALTELAKVLVQGQQQQSEATNALIKAVMAPKELTRDDKGRPSGVRPVLQ